MMDAAAAREERTRQMGAGGPDAFRALMAEEVSHPHLTLIFLA